MIRKVDLATSLGIYHGDIDKDLQDHIDCLERYQHGKQRCSDDIKLISIKSILNGLKSYNQALNGREGDVCECMYMTPDEALENDWKYCPKCGKKIKEK